jgi:glutamate dehydrogenase (NAD(P)+)/glutamate dehydrogenase (NADP+)
MKSPETPIYIPPKQLSLDVAVGDDITRHFMIPRNEQGPIKIARVYSPKDDMTHGFVAVDNLQRGPSLGGIRVAEDVTVEEVYGLAAAMTLKSAAAMLPLGGGKAGIIAPPSRLAEHPEHRHQLMTEFAKALWDLPEYVPGPDMGTSEEDMQLLYEVFTELSGHPGHGRGGVGRPPEKGGLPIDAWGITAHGLFAAARVTEDLVDDFSIEGTRVIVQGFGNVGANIAAKLAAVGAVVVGASDITGALYRKDGLDLEELMSLRREPAGLAGYAGPADEKFGHDSLESLLELPCDVLVPAARPDAITSANADRIDTRVVLQGANNPVPKVVEYYLRRSKNVLSLTDWIVNAGGVIGCAVELKMDSDEKYRDKVLAGGQDGRTYLEDLVYETVSRNVREMFERAASAKKRGEDKILREHAFEMAEHRLADEKLRSTAWL